ncbi:Uncharacterized protein MLTONO_4109 [Mesorhizobium loti]|nr:Uncharacterized protein MLTONO_4109 [Mesorhizobium loti]
MALVDIAGEVAGAGAATAGLLLVFMGNANTAFDSYTTEQQDSVRAKYQTRSFDAFIGLVLALVSCGLALLTEAIDNRDTAFFSVLALVVSLGFVVVAAWQTHRDIG